MSGEEAETFRGVGEQHRGEVAVSDTDCAVVGDGAGNAERLNSDADRFGGFGGRFYVLFQGDGRAEGIRPGGVFKRDILNSLDSLVAVNAFGVSDPCFGEILYAVFRAGGDTRFPALFPDLISDAVISSLESIFARVNV